MKTSDLKLSLVLLLVGVLVVFAAWRVWPYVQNPREVKQAHVQKQLEKKIVKSVVPKYDADNLSEEDAIDLSNRLKRKIQSAMLALPDSEKINSTEVQRIAEAFSDFVLVNRFGDLNKFLSQYPHEPRSTLVQEDAKRAESAWLYSVAWARHGPIQVDTIQVVARYIRGVEKAEPPYYKGLVQPRPLVGGGWLSVDGAKHFTAYEIRMNVLVPSLSGEEEYAVELGATVINDGAHGEWSVIETRYIGLEQGQYTTLPYP